MFIVYNYMSVGIIGMFYANFLSYYHNSEIIFQGKMPFERGLSFQGCMYMGVNIDQMTNAVYFPTQKDHLYLL